ncbi:MAG TPA: hypothetical protein VH062_19200 [Polyangiaceae bacterium]|jgi:hypothetical protein|nr:hypothetical protein [Polyangiaceae bacterium]
MLPRLVPCASIALALLVIAGGVRAEDSPPGPTEQQISAFLAEKPASADVSKAPEAPEAPPPPPRTHGFVLESSIGAQGQLGALNHVSHTAPWFHVAFGWEPTKWFMVLGQGDLSIASTTLANPPPDPRGYALWAIGGAGRFTVQPFTSVGLYAQGELGVSSVSNDVLSTYGYKKADEVGAYFGGLIGVEWYQVSPHYALALQGGVRDYPNLARAIGGDTAIALLGAASLRYTF